MPKGSGPNRDIGFVLGALIVALALAFALAGCGEFDAATVPAAAAPTAATPAPTATPDPAAAATQELVAEYNNYREALGQAPITPGLACSLYTVPTTTAAIIGATLTGVGSFLYTGAFNIANQPVTNGFPVLPPALRPIYQTWFIVKCSGLYVATTSQWYEFDTTSDDGSNLYADGALVVNNDGLHGAQKKSGARFLQANVHSFEVDFFQSSGSQALVVNVNGALLPAASLYH
jgi:hypothetical protein